MISPRATRRFISAVLITAAATMGIRALAQSTDDPVVARIIQLGQTDNRVMTWNDFASNRFGGRETGSNAYTDATQWAVWQFKQFGLEAELDEVGEVPVGFNRGPWFGRMLKPAEKELRFATPSYTSGTKGIQRGGVAILRADPFSIPGRNTTPENIEKKRAAVQGAIAEVNANKAAFKDKWVLIAGNSTGFGRDGRRGTPEYADAQLMPPLTQALVDAGALGTIQSAPPTTRTPSATMAAQSQPPLQDLDGYATSWDKLPVLPDIKLLDTQYAEIKAAAEKGQPVELEFDIRNWFKMGPIKYHNVVATLRGSTYPDEYIVIGGHFDSFSGGTGAIDDGSGFAPGMEAIRLIAAAGAKPKRTIIMILFAAEENGLVGSQSWLKRHPELQPKIVMMINRDQSPMAIVGAQVPGAWYDDLDKVTAPLKSLYPKWPFQLTRNDYPSAAPTTPGGTDSSSFSMLKVPTLNFRTQTDYVYNYAWHTTNDLYSELVPYTEQQKESATITAVVAYGAANLERRLPNQGIYLDDGLYADITTTSGKRLMAQLDFQNAPLAVANFIRITEGKSGPPAAGGRGGPGAGPAGPGGGGRGAAAPATAPATAPAPGIGAITVKGGLISALIVSDVQKAAAMKTLPKMINPALAHDAAGVLGLSAPNAIYLTLDKNPALDKKSTAFGRVIAGASLLAEIKPGDAIQSVRFTRVGQPARDFKVDDDTFKQLLDKATVRK